MGDMADYYRDRMEVNLDDDSVEIDETTDECIPAGLTHLRGCFPMFLCGETFNRVYSLSGETSQGHTDDRAQSTCPKCNELYDVS